MSDQLPAPTSDKPKGSFFGWKKLLNVLVKVAPTLIGLLFRGKKKEP